MYCAIAHHGALITARTQYVHVADATVDATSDPCSACQMRIDCASSVVTSQLGFAPGMADMF